MASPSVVIKIRGLGSFFELGGLPLSFLGSSAREDSQPWFGWEGGKVREKEKWRRGESVRREEWLVDCLNCFKTP